MSKSSLYGKDLSLNIFMLFWMPRHSLSHKHLRGNVCWSKHGEGSFIFVIDDEVNVTMYDVYVVHVTQQVWEHVTWFIGI